MFKISKIPLEKITLKKNFAKSKDGAFIAFEGLIRSSNGGKNVRKLEYEVYGKLAVEEGLRILREAKEKFDISDAKCFHREGALKIGDLGVWVGVSAGHRDEAFKACRYIIDEVKTRLPIWKKEYYKNGDSGWVNLLASK